MTKAPSDIEVIGTVVLTTLVVTLVGIGAITVITWVLG
jgi:hypothetical protein